MVITLSVEIVVVVLPDFCFDAALRHPPYAGGS